jgi:hypothetical protein
MSIPKTRTKSKPIPEPLATPATATGYYKVLKDGKSFHDGNTPWPLPTQNGDKWNPGEWMEIPAEQQIKICSVGLHLTNAPIKWFAHGATAYHAEHETEGMVSDDEDKIAVRRARLIQPCTEEELNEFNIYTVGTHQVGKGDAFAFGNSTVRASGNSTVRASGNSTVRAFGNSTVRAYENSTVRAFENSTVEAYENSVVTSTPYHSVADHVKTADKSVWIDRRQSAVRVVVGGVEYAPETQTEVQGK